MRILMGVDIGQRVDPAAIAVVQQVWRERKQLTTQAAETVQGLPIPPRDHYLVRYLKRLPLGMTYPQQSQWIRRLADKVEELVYASSLAPVGGDMQPGDAVSVEVFVDATGVGQGVVDMLAANGLKHTPVYFRAGDRREVYLDKFTKKPRIELGKSFMVSRMQVLFQTHRIHLAKTSEAEVLEHELMNYQIKVDDKAALTAGVFKTGEHDDLVTALGLATNEPVKFQGGFVSAGGGLVSATADKTLKLAGGFSGPDTLLGGSLFGARPGDAHPLDRFRLR